MLRRNAFILLVVAVLPNVALAIEPYDPADLLRRGCFDAAAGGLGSVSDLHLHSIADITEARHKLISQIWRGKSLPANVPERSETATEAHRAKASGLFEILTREGALSTEQRLEVDLGQGLVSVIYLWSPRTRNNALFLLHDGHADNALNDLGQVERRALVSPVNEATIVPLLKAGFDVMWLQMPLYGDNLEASAPHAPLTGSCGLGCDRHGELFARSSPSESAFRYFLEPVIVGLNYAMAQSRYQKVLMMGASGGGWTTLLSAAIETRIDESISVAGSVPLRFRHGVCGESSVGDAEQQTHRGLLYGRVTYADLYLMAASGLRRKHIQINNRFDSCCFFGEKFVNSADRLARYTAEKGLGSYKFVLDSEYFGHGYHYDANENLTLTRLLKGDLKPD